MIWLDWAVMAAYFGALLWISWRVIRQNKDTADDYFLAGRNLSWWIVGSSIFASNIGSEHLVGLAGSGATDGVAMAHYELHAWCLLVLAWVFVPFYMRSKVFTMPEFLEKRFSPANRWALSVISLFAYVLTKIAVGIFAGGIVFSVLLPEMHIGPLDSFWVGSILVIVLTTGTLRLEEITAQQVSGFWLGFIPQWNVFLHPLAFGILFITMLAESNRTPFDTAEAEQELVGGYHTEYSALKFGMFFLAEYSHMITASAFICVLFLGGWHLPWLSWTQPEATQWYAVLAKMVVLSGKIAFLIFLTMWIRWTLPRFRFDQIMRIAWQRLIPITLGLVVLTTTLLYFGEQKTLPLALAGNIFLLVLMLAAGGTARSEVTGRQANLPPIGAGAQPIGRPMT